MTKESYHSVLQPQALGIIRNHQPVLVGSAALGNQFRDYDFLVCAKCEAEAADIEAMLSKLGFCRQVPIAGITDPRVRSAWALGMMDIQIALPIRYASKANAHRRLLKNPKRFTMTKKERYQFLLD